MQSKIEKSNVQDIVELNMVQQGMLFHYLRDSEKNLYNVQLSLSIEGSINIEILKQAITVVQSNNEVLRSVFDWEKVDRPLQIILKQCPVDLKYVDLSRNAEKDILRLVQEYSYGEYNGRFDLTKLPFRLSLIKTSGTSF